MEAVSRVRHAPLQTDVVPESRVQLMKSVSFRDSAYHLPSLIHRVCYGWSGLGSTARPEQVIVLAWERGDLGLWRDHTQQYRTPCSLTDTMAATRKVLMLHGYALIFHQKDMTRTH